MVRLVKYWNALSGYPYDSFDLEKRVVAHDFGLLGLYLPPDLKGYFFEFMESLSDYWAAQWKQDKIARAKEIISEVKELERLGHWSEAEAKIKKLIPNPVITRKTLLG